MNTLRLFILLMSATLAIETSAQSNDDYRGGWIADINGTRHIYYIVLRNNTVSGFYCIDCENPKNLAFIDDGKIEDDGLSFSLYFDTDHKRPAKEEVRVQIRTENGASKLIVKKQHENSEIVLHRDPMTGPPPIADFTTNRPAGVSQRILSGKPETITPEKISGLWLWGTGPAKQYFIFRRHKDGVRGMVCGPCDSVSDMGPLEEISIDGINLHFEIVHEDNGFGFPEHGPHSNITDAVISHNEMHTSFYSSYSPPGARTLDMTLFGPVTFLDSKQDERSK